MRNATYELAMPASPTSLSTARATASVVTSFATTEAATAISTVARTITIASVAIAVNASVKCSGMAIACSARDPRARQEVLHWRHQLRASQTPSRAAAWPSPAAPEIRGPARRSCTGDTSFEPRKHQVARGVTPA
eukprot:CAMPEP_0118847208 /NCGR_PEP_ID=MMETSP1162-20130426/92854_1 /TAXON_ID=33656 /ORGANISM="Phaeocystis Sp, Strain CCMP2710" /LENGTH=134 /DNA_ID=CAMNT_0006779399 /DNA_START=440 /DNA_END=844 /DNA_ORIENTATION=+